MAMNFSESAKSGIRSTQALNAGVGPKDRQTIALIDLAIPTEKNTPTNLSGSGISLTDRLSLADSRLDGALRKLDGLTLL